MVEGHAWQSGHIRGCPSARVRTIHTHLFAFFLLFLLWSWVLVVGTSVPVKFSREQLWGTGSSMAKPVPTPWEL